MSDLVTNGHAAAALNVTIRARQRLALGRGTASAFYTPSHHHLPGSVLRGAIAKAWLSWYGRPDADFRRVFDGAVRFGPAFADGSDLRPLSVRSCKYGPGHCATWYADCAFPAPDGVPQDWLGGHWESGRGEVVAAEGTPLPMSQVTSTAIRHSSGTAADGQLFSRGAIDSGTDLSGTIVGPAADLDVLSQAMTALHRLELGGGSSVRGSADVSVEARNVDAVPAGRLLSIHLVSPALLVDAAGRPHLDLAAALRSRGLTGPMRNSWVRPLTEGVGGFHAASRTPKPSEIAAAPGSTVVLEPAAGDHDRIADLLATGLGLRRAEGFGWLRVMDSPWRYPARSARFQAPAANETDGDFSRLRTQVESLGLTPTHRRWLRARLTETLGSAATVDGALRQPGARGLSEPQRATLTEVLTQPQGRRRRLADHLREVSQR
ncbi:MAG: hypothetical protein ACRCYU_04270 [Nocardioides sp.]